MAFVRPSWGGVQFRGVPVSSGGSTVDRLGERTLGRTGASRTWDRRMLARGRVTPAMSRGRVSGSARRRLRLMRSMTSSWPRCLTPRTRLMFDRSLCGRSLKSNGLFLRAFWLPTGAPGPRRAGVSAVGGCVGGEGWSVGRARSRCSWGKGSIERTFSARGVWRWGFAQQGCFRPTRHSAESRCNLGRPRNLPAYRCGPDRWGGPSVRSGW